MKMGNEIPIVEETEEDVVCLGDQDPEQCESLLIKSGFILNLGAKVNSQGDCGAESKSGLTGIQCWNDLVTHEMRIKLWHWGEHPQLHRVPGGHQYPELSVAELVEIIDDYLQKGSTSTEEVQQARRRFWSHDNND